MLKRTAIAGLRDGVVPRRMVLVEVSDNHEEADTGRRHSEKPLQRPSCSCSCTNRQIDAEHGDRCRHTGKRCGYSDKLEVVGGTVAQVDVKAAGWCVITHKEGHATTLATIPRLREDVPARDRFRRVTPRFAKGSQVAFELRQGVEQFGAHLRSRKTATEVGLQQDCSVLD